MSQIQQLIKRNYESIVNRGLIKWDTNIFTFMAKIDEEHTELKEAVREYYKNEEDITAIKEEASDLILVCMNFLKFLGADVEKEIVKNIVKNEKRAKGE